MRILLLASAYNGLCQRAHIELQARGHDVSVELAIDDATMREGVDLYQPELILCPFLKHRIPEDLWREHRCIIIHPGIRGDRGPSSLDWAILDGESTWGVTALQAAEEMDAGDIWATATFPMRSASKASLYRQEVTQAAMRVILETVERAAQDDFVPEPLDPHAPGVRGRLRPLMKQADRRIDWSRDEVEAVLRKVRAADSVPGVRTEIAGQPVFAYGAHREDELRGDPGTVIARRDGAVCLGTVDGAVWLSHLRRPKALGQRFFKLPAAKVLGDAVAGVPEVSLEPCQPIAGETFREIWYEEQGAVGTVHFDFYNGAMSTEQCLRLRDAYRAARRRPTEVIVLASGRDFWSNGIHLNLIEAAEDPAEESWRNINAIDDLVEEILRTDRQLTISALRGNAGAGGVAMALASDLVLARGGVVLNPHYKTMGLFGSEYWTYLLPRRVGQRQALELTEGCGALGVEEALSLGLVDGVLPAEDYLQQIAALAQTLARSDDRAEKLAAKREALRLQEERRPLAEFRRQELEKMRENFFGPQSSYHQARRDFVYKRPLAETPARLAEHRKPGATHREGGLQPLTTEISHSGAVPAAG